MADTYGALTGRAGVCLATLGPGAINLMLGIANAQLDRHPLVAIAAQASLDRIYKESHQFVDLATNAAGWLNEGLASFFEGCRILQNGTVLMNMPADHRLFPLVDRVKRGWMTDEKEGISTTDKGVEPSKAPTFRIVLENKYEWGPPWYAPTWGVVYFLYNYQDPWDGRFIYRKAFREFIERGQPRAEPKAATENTEK